MAVFQETLELSPRGRGLHEMTEMVAQVLARSRMACGVLTLLCRHTSASLVIMENADPSARRDLEAWLDRLVPAADPHFEHTQEGPDDRPSHIKMALTRTSDTVPFAGAGCCSELGRGFFCESTGTRCTLARWS